MRPSDFTPRTEAAEQTGERDDNVTSTNKNFSQGQHYESESTLRWPADLPSVTICDLPIPLAQAVGRPASGRGDSLLGGQGRVDDRGSAGDVYCLEALYDWCVHLADLRRQLDGPIQQLRVCNDLRDQTHRFGPGRTDDLTCHREPAGHPGPDNAGQPRGHACTGQYSHPGVSVGEDRSVGCHEEVATEGHLHAAGNRWPVYRSQNRLVQLGDLRDAILGVKPFKIGRPISLDLLKIKAGTERRIRTGQYHRAHRSIAISVH
jgi:hypothetical protein